MPGGGPPIPGGGPVGGPAGGGPVGGGPDSTMFEGGGMVEVMPGGGRRMSGGGPVTPGGCTGADAVNKMHNG